MFCTASEVKFCSFCWNKQSKVAEKMVCTHMHAYV